MKSNWLPYYHSDPDAWLRLFCFPYAGGGAAIYRTWTRKLLDGVDVCAVQLPGRETRLAEPPFDCLRSLVESMAKALLPYFDRPCAFFGHSMGALLAFELAHQLGQGKIDLQQIFVSARAAPHLEPDDNGEPPTTELNEEQLVEKLRRLKGTPHSILDNRELREIILPTVRSDFTMLEAYRYRQVEPLRCPILAYGGLQDSLIAQQELAAWEVQTRDRFVVRLFPGDHFYLQSQQRLLLDTISRDLLPLYQKVKR